MQQGHSHNYFGSYRDFWWNKGFLDLTAQRLELSKYSNMLDVGCGQGHWTKTLAPYLAPEAKITAIDNDENWFKSNMELEHYFSISQVDFSLKKGDAEDIPFDDETFDLVTCQTVLIHLKNPKKALSEMTRVLKPNGLLLCVEPNNIVQTLTKNSISQNDSIDETLDHIKYRLIIEKGKKKLGEGDNSLGDLLPGWFAMETMKDIQVRLSDKAIAMYPPYDNKEQIATLKQWMQGSAWKSETRKDIDYFNAAGEEYMPFYFEYQEKYDTRSDHIMGAVQREKYHAAGGSLMYLVSGIK
ncbi:class I SAM-dependent methyltransferase [Zunongwangia endophytica]|uniref:Class I SAM-dependent methyltransferase n=1 Tax=Zunongwangia endophytica TaxID=1808945 RepID=A0ABV8HDU7_9FLAO|nr:class I SAM-dependent methyltransferase [Zunongwangia endophytica]MDN3593337.1 class I SAM-dependent methyltransferase [Zunongwangia endophytica]